MAKQPFYFGQRAKRKNDIVKFYLESADTRATQQALQIYKDTGDITIFEQVLEDHIEPAFLYIPEEGQSEDFAQRLILHFGIRQTPTEPTTPIEKQRYGTVSGHRVKIISHKKYTSKTGKVFFRARDSKGRFVKVSK